MTKRKELTAPQTSELLKTLENRFQKNQHRHPNILWTIVLDKITKEDDKLWSLQQMEQTGGEPDVIAYDKSTDQFTFCDCSPESPKGRRSLCYDNQALVSRKENKPANSALTLAEEMGLQLLSEEAYYRLQQLEEFDTKTSSWLYTPSEVRAKGGALFGDRRFGRTFIYHNGAESYYAARGFRGTVNV